MGADRGQQNAVGSARAWGDRPFRTMRNGFWRRVRERVGGWGEKRGTALFVSTGPRARGGITRTAKPNHGSHSREVLRTGKDSPRPAPGPPVPGLATAGTLSHPARDRNVRACWLRWCAAVQPGSAPCSSDYKGPRGGARWSKLRSASCVAKSNWRMPPPFHAAPAARAEHAARMSEVQVAPGGRGHLCACFHHFPAPARG